ncbi:MULTISPECIES: SCO1860 family LAETG-anchored protein [unclassified Streptomyces]|uniref:SCO1860 family LAETG-anchored protein n=1 Tax=unclassified Streptomyces TaxID=2593676 RepID=UPI002E35D184|nr:SCO1860 family LAETG-anchored protein [Streptomyces sp. NBC_01268]
MNSNTFRMPVRRSAAAATVAALAVGPVLLVAPAAHATDGKGAEGHATAVVLRAGLDVNLLNKAVSVPLRASLNEVEAPASARRTALTVQVKGAENNKPVDVLRADVATSEATVHGNTAKGYVNLVKARVHVPGLPLLSLVEVEKVTSQAVCEAGRRPVAESNLLGHITVLGKKTTLSTGGRTKVSVPGVGEVVLDLSRTSTTSRTAAATALELKVTVNPLDLNVAEVSGRITLAEATCATPAGSKPSERPSERPSEQPSQQPSEQPSQQPSTPPSHDTGVTTNNGGTTPTENLAETGGSSMTPYLAGGAVLLLGVGGGSMLLARGRARARG